MKRNLIFLLFSICFLFPGWPVSPLFISSGRADDCGQSELLVTELGQRFEKILQINNQRPRIRLVHRSPSNPARYLRVLIDPVEVDSKGWRLIIRDVAFRPLQILGPLDFIDSEGKLKRKRWTRRLPGSILRLELKFIDTLTRAELKIREYIAMPEDAENPFYSIQTDAPAWHSLFDEGVRTDFFRRSLGDGVGLLMSSRIPKSWCCSGVVIAVEPEILFLTNFHCGGLPGLPDESFWTETTCRSTLIDLSWDGDDQSREYSCAEVVAVNPKLDVAVLKITSLDRDEAPIPQPVRREPVGEGERLDLIHHPACKTKKISKNCQVTNPSYPGWRSEEKIDFAHVCDTENGSSGAPLFDEAGNLCGLHHLGFETDPETGKCDRINKAIRMDKIMKYLENIPRIRGIRFSRSP